jgi:diadenosine tetraphosphate (Ap4A) HIT family hydrolase
MEQIIKDGVCPFCREHFEQYHTKPILAEDAHWVLTENFAPYEGSTHHFLLVAKVHVTGFWELSPEAQVAFFAMLEQARQRADTPGGTVLMRWGDTDFTGASVRHLHAQMVFGVTRSESSGPILTSLGYKKPTADGNPEPK